MPYAQLEHAITRYCAVTGVRAILADQGQNDWPERDEDRIFANYRAWIEQAVVPLTRERPDWNAPIARGAAWRAVVNRRFFTAMEHHFSIATRAA